MVVAIATTGCGTHGLFHSPGLFGSSRVPTALGNPAQISDHPSEFVWNQVVDTIDDYFQIKDEIQVVKGPDQWLEGRLETFPEIGSTYFEPWRKEALPGYQRLQSTLQTIRRTAVVKVIPNGAGYLIDVEVRKDLEDVDRSLSAADGSAATRHDGAVVRADPALVGQPITLAWIEQERDTELEQRILQEIVGRTTNVTPPRSRLLHD